MTTLCRNLLIILLTASCLASEASESRFKEASRLMSEGKDDEAIALLEELSQSGSELEQTLSKSTLSRIREVRAETSERQEELELRSKRFEEEKEILKAQNLMPQYVDLDSYTLLDLSKRISEKHREILDAHESFKKGELIEKEYNRKLFVYTELRSTLLDVYFEHLRKRCVENMDSELGIPPEAERELLEEYGLGANQSGDGNSE